MTETSPNNAPFRKTRPDQAERAATAPRATENETEPLSAPASLNSACDNTLAFAVLVPGVAAGGCGRGPQEAGEVTGGAYFSRNEGSMLSSTYRSAQLRWRCGRGRSPLQPRSHRGRRRCGGS
jgi:hypothetical protein